MRNSALVGEAARHRAIRDHVHEQRGHIRVRGDEALPLLVGRRADRARERMLEAHHARVTRDRRAPGLQVVEHFRHEGIPRLVVDMSTRSVYFDPCLTGRSDLMLYSATTQYAIRALAYMATLPVGQRILARDLAEATGVPRQFLGKILHRLARHGLLESAKGRGGGFRFARLPESIPLAELVVAVEGEDIMKMCVLGLDQCNDSQPCPLHDQWKAFSDRMRDRIHAATIADLGRNLKAKR